MPDNPYMVGDPSSGGGPSYSRPLMDFQGMAKGIGDAWDKARQQQQQQQPGQLPQGGPMNIRSPAQMQGMPPNLQSGTMQPGMQGGQQQMQGGQQPMQGWGQRLQQWLQQRQGMPQGGPQFGGPQPPVPTSQGPTGLY